MVTIRDNRRNEILGFHWDPISTGTRPYPHLHVGSSIIDNQHRIFRGRFSRHHIPTGFVGITAVVRFLIEELEVVALRNDWESVLGIEGI